MPPDRRACASKGPEIRTGKLAASGGELSIEPGNTVDFVFDEAAGGGTSEQEGVDYEVYVDYENLHGSLSVGSPV